MATGTVGSMGRKKLKPEERKAPSVTFTVRVSPAYFEWLEGYSKSKRLRTSDLIDQALAKLAHSEGYEEPPARIE